ncbi:MAG: hypothetical protein QXS29_06195 [Nitrososphaeria archaeon]
MKERVRPMASIVLDIIEKHPEAAEEYDELRFYYLRDYCGLPYLDRETYMKVKGGLAKLSTLERAYRKLKEKGIIRISEYEEKRREVLQAEIAQEMVRW